MNNVFSVFSLFAIEYVLMPTDVSFIERELFDNVLIVYRTIGLFQNCCQIR